jgi:hypothetical protein
MPSLWQWLPRARVRYLPLNNDTIEMADHTVIPTNAHEEARDSSVDKKEFPTDVAGGALTADALTKRGDASALPAYQHDRASVSTLNDEEEADDVSEEDLATLRRVSDRIPLSAWYSTFLDPQLMISGSLSWSNFVSASPITDCRLLFKITFHKVPMMTPKDILVLANRAPLV